MPAKVLAALAGERGIGFGAFGGGNAQRRLSLPRNGKRGRFVNSEVRKVMNVVRPLRVNLDAPSILHFISTVVDVLGPRWVNRKLQEASAKKPRRKESLKKYSYLYGPPRHTLIDWLLHVDRWRAECLRTRRLALSQPIAKLATLGRALELVRSQKHFNKLVGRLKRQDQFDAAAFEAEVAASYVSRGWEVEFIEEGNQKTPDLRVFTSDGSIFHAECKCRDKLTERDKKLSAIWQELEGSLLRHLGPRRLNYAVIIKARVDPDRSDVETLRETILKAVSSGGMGEVDIKSQTFRTIPDDTGRFDIAVQFLSGPDQEIEAPGLQFGAAEKLDRIVMGAEMKVDDSGRKFIRNPIILAFKTATPPDRVTGLIHSLRAASSQLPEKGPGVVWIRVPDNSWGGDVKDSFARAEQLIREQLTNGRNRRVNAVFLMTRAFRRLEKDGLQGLVYTPLVVRVDHDNPETPAATDLSVS